MGNNLQTDIEKYLGRYSIDVKYWSSQTGDTHFMLGNRLFLQTHLADLTEEQQQRMKEIDQRVLALAAVDYEVGDNESDDDIRTLGFVADVINGISIPPAGEAIKFPR